jgi:hypothetical protein
LLHPLASVDVTAATEILSVAAPLGKESAGVGATWTKDLSVSIDSNGSGA